MSVAADLVRDEKTHGSRNVGLHSYVHKHAYVYEMLNFAYIDKYSYVYGMLKLFAGFQRISAKCRRAVLFFTPIHLT